MAEGNKSHWSYFEAQARRTFALGRIPWFLWSWGCNPFSELGFSTRLSSPLLSQLLGLRDQRNWTSRAATPCHPHRNKHRVQGKSILCISKHLTLSLLRAGGGVVNLGLYGVTETIDLSPELPLCPSCDLQSPLTQCPHRSVRGNPRWPCWSVTKKNYSKWWESIFQNESAHKAVKTYFKPQRQSWVLIKLILYSQQFRSLMVWVFVFDNEALSVNYGDSHVDSGWTHPQDPEVWSRSGS